MGDYLLRWRRIGRVFVAMDVVLLLRWRRGGCFFAVEEEGRRLVAMEEGNSIVAMEEGWMFATMEERKYWAVAAELIIVYLSMNNDTMNA